MPQMFDWILYAILGIPLALAIFDLVRTPR
jgi:hypothetical protein